MKDNNRKVIISVHESILIHVFSAVWNSISASVWNAVDRPIVGFIKNALTTVIDRKIHE